MTSQTLTYQIFFDSRRSRNLDGYTAQYVPVGDLGSVFQKAMHTME